MLGRWDWVGGVVASWTGLDEAQDLTHSPSQNFAIRKIKVDPSDRQRCQALTSWCLTFPTLASFRLHMGMQGKPTAGSSSLSTGICLWGTGGISKFLNASCRWMSRPHYPDKQKHTLCTPTSHESPPPRPSHLFSRERDLDTDAPSAVTTLSLCCAYAHRDGN